MKYMPAESEETCKFVSQQLYNLTRPANRDPSDVSTYLFGWQQDSNGAWWMCWDESLELPIHAARSGEMAQAIMQWVVDGRLTQQSAIAIQSTVQLNVGRSITLGQITPPEWLAVMQENIALPR